MPLRNPWIVEHELVFERQLNFPLYPRLRGSDQVVFRSFLSLVSWGKFVPSFAKSSLNHSLTTAITCLLGHTEPLIVS